MSQLTVQSAVDVNYAKMRFPVWGFAKVDGVRGAHITGGLTGRSLDPFKNTALVARFASQAYAGFDGELTINGWLTRQEVPEGETLCSLTTGLCNRFKLKKGETELLGNAVWNLFDWLHPDVVGLPYGERYRELESYLAELGPAHVRLLPYRVIDNIEQAEAFCIEMLDAGYEGAVFRDPKAMHKSGRTTESCNDFWRWKPVSDKDAICTGFEEAETNNNEAKVNSLGRTERSAHKGNKVGNGMVGTVLGLDVLTGKPFRCGPGALTHKQRTEMFNDPTLLVGHPFKYTSLDTGVKDEPRQARFASLRARADMTPADLALLAKWEAA